MVCTAQRLAGNPPSNAPALIGFDSIGSGCCRCTDNWNPGKAVGVAALVLCPSLARRTRGDQIATRCAPAHVLMGGYVHVTVWALGVCGEARTRTGDGPKRLAALWLPLCLVSGTAGARGSTKGRSVHVHKMSPIHLANGGLAKRRANQVSMRPAARAGVLRCTTVDPSPFPHPAPLCRLPH